MPDIMPTSLVAAVATHRTSKFIRNGLIVFERGENLLQFSQLSEIALES